jgi:uncharacterized protein
VLGQEELQAAVLYYDINEIGEMHHNPAKNVLFVQASPDEIARRMNIPLERVKELLNSAKTKMYAERLKRVTPYVDKTVYVGWNSLCVTAYLEAARVLKLDGARQFALRSLDRVLNRAWKRTSNEETASGGLLMHVVSYSDPTAEHREVPGMLDDYAFTALACLDAYEATVDLTYFNFARAITDAMIARFYDSTSGGFFDSELKGDAKKLGVLGTARKPLQDSPTPAGNPMAAIALIRMNHYTGQQSYRDKAEETLETFAGVAEQFGIFAATFGIAVLHYLESPVQVVVVAGDDGKTDAAEMLDVAIKPFGFNKTVLHLAKGQVVAANLPPVLAETIPNLPQVHEKKSVAVICSGRSCQPPVFGASDLNVALGRI